MTIQFFKVDENRCMFPITREIRYVNLLPCSRPSPGSYATYASRRSTDVGDVDCNCRISTWVITTLIHCTFCFAILRTRTTGLFEWHIATLVKRQPNPSQREVHPFHHGVSCLPTKAGPVQASLWTPGGYLRGRVQTALVSSP